MMPVVIISAHAPFTYSMGRAHIREIDGGHWVEYSDGRRGEVVPKRRVIEETAEVRAVLAQVQELYRRRDAAVCAANQLLMSLMK